MWMKHPDLPDNEPVEVAQTAFDTAWRHRGWQEADPPADPELADNRDAVRATSQPGEAVLTPEAIEHDLHAADDAATDNEE